MTLRHVATTFALVLAGSLPTHSAWAADPANPAARRAHAAKPPFPQITLADRVSRGQRAVDLLGARLPAVAAWYGKSPDELRALLLGDRRLRLDARGRLFVEDELEAPLAATASAATAAENSVLDGTLLPLDQTFLLHSRPGAKRTIYLNFKGATLANTAWNTAGTITALPFDTDGLPYSFTTAELQRIQAIWQRVAEDYAPFDVNVTTEPPPADALTRSSGTDQVFGTTVLITSSSGVYSCSCGGVAYLGIFDDTGDYYKPALVFYNQLGSGNEKYVAEAISHEAGHNIGLQHDGYSGGGYYPGHGSGATGWAPIMGVGYYQSLVQWSKGQYTTANNTQDDFAVAESNGLPVRLDDHGDSAGTATMLAGTAAGGITSFAAQGVVERASDIDTFAFVSGAGTVSVAVGPAARSPNLDVLVELRDAGGQLLASANPADALTATLSAVLPAAGTYYVSVQGIGKGDAMTTGYTDYGSVGNYAISIGAPTSSSGQPPVAALTAAPASGTVPLTVTLSAAGSSDADGTIASYAWNFGDGSSGSGASTSHVYSTAGNFTALLTVTDNNGLTATKSVTISAKPVVTVVPMGVADIAMSFVPSGNRVRANAAVKLLDTAGKPVVGATVAGRWSGAVNGSVSGVTDATGAVRLASALTTKRGTFTFTVTGATLAGHAYDSTLNVETSDSISR